MGLLPILPHPLDQTVADFNADIPSTIALIYRRGNATDVGMVYRSATITSRAGWFGPAHRAPAIPPDPALWPPADFDAVVEAFRATGFRPGNAWYLNDDANIAYAQTAPESGRLRQPVLFVNGECDAICDITRTRLGEPMHRACQDLSVVSLPAGHWSRSNAKPSSSMPCDPGSRRRICESDANHLST